MVRGSEDAERGQARQGGLYDIVVNLFGIEYYLSPEKGVCNVVDEFGGGNLVDSGM